MASEDNWVGNLLNWFIGYVIAYIWIVIGSFLSLFGMWQLPADGIIGAFTQFAPTELDTSVFTSAMTIGSP